MHLRLDALVHELSDESARSRSGRSRGDQGRRGETHEDTDGAAPLDPFSAPMVGGLLHAHRPVLGVRDEDRRLDLHLLVGDELGERVEVPRRRVNVRVAPDEDICVCVSHYLFPSL